MTIDVKDAANVTRTLETPNPNGRAAAAGSRPVALSNEDLAALGGLTETAPATDTASSGLNGRAQRIAQRLTSLIGLFPATIGQKAKTGSLGVTLASDDNLLVAIGEVQASPTANTVLDRLKAILTGIVLAAGTNIIGKIGIDQTTDGTTNRVNVDSSLKSGTATRSNVNSGTGSVAILASNAARKGATIFNSDPNALLLDLSGGTAASTRCQVRLTQYQSYEVGSGFTGAITGIWEADGTGIADVVEFT